MANQRHNTYVPSLGGYMHTNEVDERLMRQWAIGALNNDEQYPQKKGPFIGGPGFTPRVREYPDSALDAKTAEITAATMHVNHVRNVEEGIERAEQIIKELTGYIAQQEIVLEQLTNPQEEGGVQ